MAPPTRENGDEIATASIDGQLNGGNRSDHMSNGRSPLPRRPSLPAREDSFSSSASSSSVTSILSAANAVGGMSISPTHGAGFATSAISPNFADKDAGQSLLQRKRQDSLSKLNGGVPYVTSTSTASRPPPLPHTLSFSSANKEDVRKLLKNDADQARTYDEIIGAIDIETKIKEGAENMLKVKWK